jgi:hypothetical protein
VRIDETPLPVHLGIKVPEMGFDPSRVNSSLEDSCALRGHVFIFEDQCVNRRAAIEEIDRPLDGPLQPEAALNKRAILAWTADGARFS